jgi:hypothetical protein
LESDAQELLQLSGSLPQEQQKRLRRLAGAEPGGSRDGGADNQTVFANEATPDPSEGMPDDFKRLLIAMGFMRDPDRPPGAKSWTPANFGFPGPSGGGNEDSEWGADGVEGAEARHFYNVL